MLNKIKNYIEERYELVKDGSIELTDFYNEIQDMPIFAHVFGITGEEMTHILCELGYN